MNILRLLKNLKWIDYLFLCIACGLIVLQVWLDLELPSYTENIMNELGKLPMGEKVEMSAIKRRKNNASSLPRRGKPHLPPPAPPQIPDTDSQRNHR